MTELVWYCRATLADAVFVGKDGVERYCTSLKAGHPNCTNGVCEVQNLLVTVLLVLVKLRDNHFLAFIFICKPLRDEKESWGNFSDKLMSGT